MGELALADFELADDGVPRDVNFVPLVLDGLERAFVLFADVAQGGRGGNEGVGFVAAGRAVVHGGEDDFEVLNDDAFDFKELLFVFGGEFLVTGKADVAVELFPTFEVGLELEDEMVKFLVAHGGGSVGVLELNLGRQENDGAAVEFAGGEFEGGVADDEFGGRQLGEAGIAEGGEDLGGDGELEAGGKCLGQGGGDNVADGVHGEATGGKPGELGGLARE